MTRFRRLQTLTLSTLAPTALVLLALSSPALTQQPTPAPAAAGQPELAPDLREAMGKADAGDPKPLTALADAGRPDAQYFAAVMLIFGRGGVAKDPARGCAYADKASATRADAAMLSGRCYQQGVGGAPDAAKAKAAYTRADQMGFPPAKCALGQLMMSDPPQAGQGLDLCKQAAKAGDDEAQLVVANVYFNGAGAIKADHGEARKWYEMAAKTKPDAARKLGEMYAAGDGGKRDTKKALQLWMTAEKAGDPLAPILVADQLFSQLTGGKKPGPGQYAFRGGIPVSDISVIEDWYKEAQQRDPRPEVKKRAEYALDVLGRFKTAAQSVSVTKQK
jgi:hypothetical protein